LFGQSHAELKVDENGSFWCSLAVETVPNGTSSLPYFHTPLPAIPVSVTSRRALPRRQDYRQLKARNIGDHFDNRFPATGFCSGAIPNLLPRADKVNSN